VYPGNNSTLTITNGIDLAGEGGMVWSKSRNTNDNNRVYDTERGTTNGLITNATNDPVAWGDFVSFNSDGYSLASGGLTSPLASNFVSWTFRKAEKFFDIQTWTGNGTAGKVISHDLNSVPQMIMVKRTDSSGDWLVYHWRLGNDAGMVLNDAGSSGSYGPLNNTTPTSTQFVLNNNANANANNGTYVAYLFAEEAAFGEDEDEYICRVDRYNGNGSTKTVDLGFEPQFLFVKKAGSAGGAADWILVDSMRGLPVGGNDSFLAANKSAAETSTLNAFNLTATGFTVATSDYRVNTLNVAYIYMAIRRPMKTPTAGTEVYNNLANRVGTSAAATISGVGFAVDLMIPFAETTGSSKPFVDRLRGATKYLLPPYTNAEQTSTNVVTSFASMDGVIVGADSLQVINNYYSSSRRYAASFFKRATGFMDVVVANASNPAAANSHNLGVVPELIIIRRTAYTGNNWSVSTNHTSTTMTSKWLNSTSVSGQGLNTAYTANYNLLGAQPTATNFTMINQSDGPFACYLFATLAGVSKVGSYTGTAATLNIDCGFSAAARFVLITRVDAAGDFYMWDSARGIVAGNSPYLIINTTGASVTNTDYIDPLSAGFTVTSSAPAALNASGGNYIFLAIA